MATNSPSPELLDLSEHLQRCRRSRGWLFTALSVLDSVDRLITPRFVTTLVAVALLGALFAML